MYMYIYMYILASLASETQGGRYYLFQYMRPRYRQSFQAANVSWLGSYPGTRMVTSRHVLASDSARLGGHRCPV